MNVDIYWMHRGELMTQKFQELVEGGSNSVELKMRMA